MKRVLIIEDEAVLRDVYTLILRKSGFKVDVAQNGKVGISKLNSFKPDLILLDMLMPVMSGVKFLQTAKLATDHPNIAIIIISNLSNPLADNEAEQLGVSASLVKASLQPSDLVEAVKKYCPK